MSSVQSLNRLGRPAGVGKGGGMEDDSAEVLLMQPLQEALVSISDIGRW